MDPQHPARGEKRPRPSNDDDDKSFIKNVTSTVAGLLSSTIAKWCNNQSAPNTNGSAMVAESTDSSTEDETFDVPVTPPPAKRMHFSPTSTSSRHVRPETKSFGTNTESIESQSAVQSTSQSTVDSTKFRPDAKNVSTPAHTLNEETNILPKEKDIYSFQSNPFSINLSIGRQRRSNFEIKRSERACEKRESKGGTYNRGQSYLTSGLFGSPFYPGNTTYGGASSSYMNRSNITSERKTIVENSTSKDNVSISHNSQRILDLLENYSSPLIEAKRIRSNSSFDNSHTNDKSPHYKTQEIQVPSIAQILLLKKRSRLANTTRTARQILASHSSSPEFAPYSVTNNERSNPDEKSEEMTTNKEVRLTQNHGEDMELNKQSTTVQSPVTYPPTLQIDNDNLPKHTLDSSVSISSSTDEVIKKTSNVVTTADGNVEGSNVNAVSDSVTKSGTENIEISNEVTSKSNSLNQSSSFKFSSPLMVREVSESDSPKLTYYNFDRPNKSREKLKSSNQMNIELLSNESQKLKTVVSQSANWKCEDCWVSNKSDSEKCVCCGAVRPNPVDKKTKQCADCKVDLSGGNSTKCGLCKTKNNEVNKPKISTNSSKWKCQDCWVVNEKAVNKCVCCGAIKPAPIVINNKCNSIEIDWVCDVCLLKNKHSADVCVACNALKPSSKNIDTNKTSSYSDSVVTKTSNDLNICKKLKSDQAGKWECSSCLVRNDNNRSKCVCCEAEKPGSYKESEQKRFSFGADRNTTFKFGIDPKLNIADKSSETYSGWGLGKAVKESEKNNNIPQSKVPTHTFNFGIPNKPVNKSPEKKETRMDIVPKWISEVFGAPKSIESPMSTIENTVESVPVKVMEDNTFKGLNEKDEKLQEVPNIEKPNSTLTETPQETLGLIGHSSVENNSNKPLSQASWSFENTEQTSNNTQNGTSIIMKMPLNSFTFSASNMKPTSNLFAAPRTTHTATSFSTKQTSPVSLHFQNSDPAVPTLYYQKNETNNAPKLLFFNKLNNVTTAVPSSLVTSAPTFTFGGSVQSNLQQTGKPKFNFTFGNNNRSETPSLFSMPTSNANNNVLGGNSLSGTNAVSGSTEGNSLPTVNPINIQRFTSGVPMEGNGSVIPTFQLISNSSKKDNMWTSGNNSGSNKMSSENNLDMGNNSSTVHSRDFFAAQVKKPSVWSAVNNTSNDSLGSLKLTTGNNSEIVNNALVMPSGTGFGVPGKKDNVWTNTTSNNIFVPNTGSNNTQKAAPFSFGSSMQFNFNNVTPAPSFGSPSQTPQNVFGISSANNNSQSSIFSNTLQNPASQNIFGTPQPVTNSAMSAGVFGSPSADPNSSFGTSNTNMTTFENTSMNPRTPPTFNFGAQQSSAVFGFGQANQSNVYNFGATAAASPQRQFSIGSASVPNSASRRVIRRAVRRTTQR